MLVLEHVVLDSVGQTQILDLFVLEQYFLQLHHILLSLLLHQLRSIASISVLDIRHFANLRFPRVKRAHMKLLLKVSKSLLIQIGAHLLVDSRRFNSVRIVLFAYVASSILLNMFAVGCIRPVVGSRRRVGYLHRENSIGSPWRRQYLLCSSHVACHICCGRRQCARLLPELKDLIIVAVPLKRARIINTMSYGRVYWLNILTTLLLTLHGTLPLQNQIVQLLLSARELRLREPNQLLIHGEYVFASVLARIQEILGIVFSID